MKVEKQNSPTKLRLGIFFHSLWFNKALKLLCLEVKEDIFCLLPVLHKRMS